MTRSDFNTRIRKLNESTVFQMVGRFAGVFAAVVLAPTSVWGLSILLAMSNDVAVLKAKVETALTDPYHGADAKRDFARRDDQIDYVRADMTEVKGRINTLEYATARRGQPQP